MSASRFRLLIEQEASSGILLMLSALIAIFLSNSRFSEGYQSLFELTQISGFSLHYSVAYWINHGLMSLFFLQVGLEIKQEFLEGELNSFKKAALPAFAALGGMLFPALIFLLLNFKHPENWSSWATPVATDIAFSLGVLQLLGRKVPSTLKLFLLALATFDDLGAIAIIAVFYTEGLHPGMLFCDLGILLILEIANRLHISSGWIYGTLGALLWFFMEQAGIDAAIAGVFLAAFVPMPLGKKWHRHLNLLIKVFVLPVFALCNAGVHFGEFSLHEFLSPLLLGVSFALVIGKPIGVLLAIWLATRLRLASIPSHIRWSQLAGIGFLCGIGFTMSLLIGQLSVMPNEWIKLDQIKTGVILGSIVSALLGFFWLNCCAKKPK